MPILSISRLHRMAPLLVAAVVSAACAQSGRLQPEASRPGADTAVTFAEHIAPVLFRSCAPCHRPDGSAPFSVLAFDEVKPRASKIAAAVESRRMPPWLPEPGYVEYSGERRLSQQEISLIRRWALGGGAQGNPALLPPLPSLHDGWQLGEPDVVVQFPIYTVPAGPTDTYRNFVARAPAADGRYIRAVEVRPGSPGVVHHGRLMVDTTRSRRTAEEHDHAAGFDGMDPSNAFSPDGFFIGWTPGRLPQRGADDLAWLLPSGADLVLQLHFPPRADARAVAPRLGIYYAPRPPTSRPITLSFRERLIDIPAGERNYVVADSFALPTDVMVLGVQPHAHFIAREMHAWARLPNGQRRWLLRIDHWNFNWQDEYRYAAPIALPKGAVVMLRYVYDNSAGNQQNPNKPPKRVTYGMGSADEMGDLFLQILARDAGETAALRRAVDWKQHTNEMAYLAYVGRAMGDSALARGAVDTAISYYREALSLTPDAVTHFALGKALAQKPDRAQALVHLRQASRLAEEDGNEKLAEEVRRVLSGLGAGTGQERERPKSGNGPSAEP
jgi:hypothetical protein